MNGPSVGILRWSIFFQCGCYTKQNLSGYLYSLTNASDGVKAEGLQALHMGGARPLLIDEASNLWKCLTLIYIYVIPPLTTDDETASLSPLGIE